MPEIVYEILDLITSLIRFLSVAVLGLGLGWLSLDLLKKAQSWQLQTAVFLGLIGITFGMSYLLPWGSVGSFALGVGLAILIWGLPRKKKEEEGKKK